MAQKTIADVRNPEEIREAVIRRLTELNAEAVREGDIETLERLVQVPFEGFMRNAASRPATPENIEWLFGRAA